MSLGMVAQENNLDPDFTVLENLIVYGGYYGIPKTKAIEEGKRLLKFVELADRENSPIQALSGGMLRRLQIARALINSPKILIMDEPTTGLDPHSRHSLWDKLKVLNEAGELTILITTHYMDEAATLCNRVAIVDRGLFVTVDNPQKLTSIYGGSLEDVYLKLTGRGLE
jgi:lipooligosaccharide transport system ATP-binding protein